MGKDRKITNIFGAANVFLNGLKKSPGKYSFKSSLTDAKSAKIAEEIIANVISEIQSSDELNKQELSKISDVILGRIADLKDNNDITADDLTQLKDSILEKLETSGGVSDEIKQQLAEISEKLVSAKEDKDSIVEQLKQVVAGDDAAAKGEEPGAEGGDDQIALIREQIDDALDEMLTYMEQNDTWIEQIKQFMTSMFDRTVGGMSEVLKSINNQVTPSAKDKKKQKKAQAAADELDKLVKKVNKILNNFNEEALKWFEEMVIPMAKIAAKGIGVIMKSVIPWLITAFWTTIGPILLIIAAAIGVIALAVAAIGFAVAELLPQIFDFLTEKVWPFFEKDFWPFFKAKVFPLLEKIANFVMGTVWAYLQNVVFPIVQTVIAIVKTIIEIVKEAWEFFKTKLWPFFEKEVWPIIRDFITWLMDEVLKPVWEDIVLPVLKFLSGKYMEVMGAVLDVIKTVVEGINAILKVITKVFNAIEKVVDLIVLMFESMKPYIKPIVDIVMTTLIDLLKIIKPVVLKLAKFLAEVFMDILTTIKWVYDNIVKPVIEGMKAFVNAIKNIGSYIWQKIKSVLDIGGAVFGAAKSAISNVGSAVKGLWSKLTGDKKETEQERLQRELKEARDATIAIDKGTIVDMKGILQELVDFLQSTLMEKVQSIYNAVVTSPDVSSVSQITASAEATESKTLSSINKQTRSQSEMFEDADHANGPDHQKPDTIGQMINRLNALFEMSEQKFGEVLEKLDNPQVVPLPIGGSNGNDYMSSENK